MSVRRNVILVSAGVALVLLFMTRIGLGQAPDPVTLSPHMYKIRLENKYVRVLEYHNSPGEKEPMHSHPPGVVYFLTDYTARTTDPTGGVTEFSRKSGDVVWRDSTAHALENIGTTEGRVLLIEFKIPLTSASQ